MIITSIVILLALVGPIIYFNGMKTRAEKKIKKLLYGLANTSNNKIDEYDLLNSAAIGIDKTSKKIFYVNMVQKANLVIDLKTVKYCKEQSQKIENQTGVEHHYLVFEPLYKTANDIKINFFDKESNSLLVSEVQLLKKWKENINSVIAYL